MLELKDIYFTVKHVNGEDVESYNILNGISYTFKKGAFYAVTGPNGSGKTTLAKTIMGINKNTSGSIFYEGQNIESLGITERAQKGIAYSFQNPARFKGLTFRELLSISMGTDDEDKIISLIHRVGICSFDFLDKSVDTKLSGGEIKKIELATTIARNPSVAIYDEPDTGIDLWTIGPMVELLKKEQTEHGTTTIVVSHNRVFLEAADVVLVINKGKIVYEGNVKDAMPMLEKMSTCDFKCDEEDGNVNCLR